MIKDVFRRRVHGYESLAGCSIARYCKDWMWRRALSVAVLTHKSHRTLGKVYEGCLYFLAAVLSSISDKSCNAWMRGTTVRGRYSWGYERKRSDRELDAAKTLPLTALSWLNVHVPCCGRKGTCDAIWVIVSDSRGKIYEQKNNGIIYLGDR